MTDLISGTEARAVSGRASVRAFLGISALLFAASAAVTIVCCQSMSTMGEMPMPGGWTMSMAWMRMCGQTWFDAAASFLGHVGRHDGGDGNVRGKPAWAVGGDLVVF